MPTMILYLSNSQEDAITIKSDDSVIPPQGLSDIFLRTEFDYASEVVLPSPGKRLKSFVVDESTGNSSNYLTDWMVEKVEELNRTNLEEVKIAIAWCKKEPISENNR
jgi:hypothetical protein